MPNRQTPAAPPAEDEQLDLPPILDLDTLHPKRATILIDKQPYELRRMGDYGIEEQHLLGSEQMEYDELWAKPHKDLNSTERKRLGLILDRLVRKALDAPKETIDKLDDEQKAQVVRVFFSASAQSLQKALAQVVQQMVAKEREDGE